MTTYVTDQLGRRTSRILPKDATESAFLTETLQYDEWGNLWKRTDFAGKTTTFGYDTLNRLKSKTADATHPSLVYSHAIARTEFDYDANGARTAARTFNAANTQLYTESTPRDERGRLTYKDTAAGRLDYGYYANNLLKDTVSSNSGGVNVGYRYDELNRLESVDDTSTGLPTRTTGYTYNANGSLETVTQPNAIVHTYGYDALNRLRGLVVTRGATLLRSYEYKLRATGHRRQAIEGTGRTTDYVYDELYRLTGETIAADPATQNGAVDYGLDKVGNRQSRTSQLATLNSQLGLSYNARDWIGTDTHTANGSTQVGQVSDLSLRGTDTYDFEEHLILRTKTDGTTINVSYNADGHRILKNILSPTATLVSTASWLVDTNNLTGYAQVAEERVTTGGATPSSTVRTYTYGHALISQADSLNGAPATLSYYGPDGFGTIRQLTDASGTPTDAYDYDAFGNLLRRTGTTTNAYLYRSEQYDADLGLYYLRARYLNPDSGRFWSQDTYEGSGSDPMSLHKYLYAHGSPSRYRDPSGHFSITEIAVTLVVASTVTMIAYPVVRPAVAMVVGSFGGPAGARYSISSIGVYGESADLLDALDIDANDFSGNLFEDAFTELGTSAIVGGIASGATAGIMNGFSAFRRGNIVAEETSTVWKRRDCVGATPGKSSRTGKAVIARMRAEGKIRDDAVLGTLYQDSRGTWRPVSTADMSHKVDAVSWWNQIGRTFGAKSPEVRRWMLDPNNYALDYFRINRSAGASLVETYLPPL